MSRAVVLGTLFVVRDVQMSQEAVRSKGCSDVPRKQFVVRDVQMSLSVDNSHAGDI